MSISESGYLDDEAYDRPLGTGRIKGPVMVEERTGPPVAAETSVMKVFPLFEVTEDERSERTSG